MNKGINFFGSWETSDGIGRAAALNIRCLESVDVPINKIILSRPVALQSGRDTVIDDHLVSSLESKINLFHFSARWVPHYFARISEHTFSGFYNIGYWVCEVPKIPDEWARQMEYFDEIWTASSFCQSAISRSVNVPVIKIPHSIDEFELTVNMQRNASVHLFRAFTFLNIFNAYSDAERKNVLFTIRAFLEAFGSRSDVRLIIKISNLEHDPLLSEKLHFIQEQHANIEIIEGYLKDNAVQALYECADAYVSLHRAEGFGLTISDAMSLGIPVITTGYSGNMEFCDASDTRLVAYSLRPVGHERLRYRKDDIWAEPDMEDAIAAFREVLAEYPLWLKKAARARKRIQQDFSEVQIGRLMRERLQLINNNFSFVGDMGQRQIEREVGIYDTYGF